MYEYVAMLFCTTNVSVKGVLPQDPVADGSIPNDAQEDMTLDAMDADDWVENFQEFLGSRLHLTMHRRWSHWCLAFGGARFLYIRGGVPVGPNGPQLSPVLGQFMLHQAISEKLNKI